MNSSSWNFKLKGMQCHSLEMLKGYNWSIEGIRKGYLTGQKCWIKGKGLNFGTLPPLMELCWVPPAPPTPGCRSTGFFLSKRKSRAALKSHVSFSLILFFHSFLIDYEVQVKTANKDRAGTDAPVYITVKGTRGSLNKRELDNKNHDDFEQGR